MRRRLVVELEPGSPPSGLVIAPDGTEIHFAGWTELAQALEPEAEQAGEPAAGGAQSE
jgi:hypothetical protein